MELSGLILRAEDLVNTAKQEYIMENAQAATEALGCLGNMIFEELPNIKLPACEASDVPASAEPA